MISLDALDGDGVRHAFFTREGGVSGGVFASLNCGFGSSDDPANVARNRAIAMRRLGLAEDNLVTCHQVHSADVVAVTEPWPREASPRADGMATARAGIALGVLAADCAPVLFADPHARVIGAAHGGWRGALGGVMEATVAAMRRLGADPHRIHAAIGPCIAQASYEVGPEFPGRFAPLDAESGAFFVPAARSGHFRFDLSGYIAHRLARLGLAAIQSATCDTAAEPARFFSYRRACLAGERDYGRALAAIALAP
ncbi:MAG: peptidoglycan editing factor PgeF [Alphaproteobacteria bacterium]|nr:peptidoglycan editing factor PgeF [Alphaproteobacteria bacterium]